MDAFGAQYPNCDLSGVYEISHLIAFLNLINLLINCIYQSFIESKYHMRYGLIFF